MKTQAIICFFLLLTGPVLASAGHCGKERRKESSWSDTAWSYGLPLAAGGAAMAAAPVVLGAAGFTAAGVAAGSVAAKAMALFGTGGWVIPALQSAGAAGLSIGAKIGLGSVVGGVTHLATKKSDDEE